MTASLNYASATPSSVRFWPLACGAAAVAFGLINQFADQVAAMLMRGSIELYPGAGSDRQFDVSWVNGLAFLAAVPLLAYALPHAGAFTRRRKMLACIGMAEARLLLLEANRAYTGVVDRLLPPGIAVWKITTGIHCIEILLDLALLASAVIYLMILGARLGRRTLGSIAAYGLIPSALGCLALLTYELTHLFDIKINHAIKSAFIRYYSRCDNLQLLWLILLWSAIAFFAAILALQKPCPSVPTSH